MSGHRMCSSVVSKNRFKQEKKYVIQRIAELREELEDLGQEGVETQLPMIFFLAHLQMNPG